MSTRRSVAVGRTYLEAGRPVTVLITWAGRGPHNALIRREDGTEVVRPFRGLRRPAVAVPEAPDTAGPSPDHATGPEISHSPATDPRAGRRGRGPHPRMKQR